MSEEVDFTGLGVALVTPFKLDESIDYDALEHLLEFQIDNGVDYLVVLGTTGEAPTLSEQEQQDVVRFVVEKTKGRIPIVVGAGDNNTKALVERIKRMDFTGVSGILSVAPYYNRPEQEGLYRHYCKVSEASPVPIILYNVPSRTGVNVDVETTLRLAHDCKNVVAVKEASGDLEQIRAIIDGAPDNFQVISGDDVITTDVILSGGVGVISVFGNAFPKEMKMLVESALSGGRSGAREQMEADFDKLFQLMFIEGNPAGVKMLLSIRGLVENVVRLPLTVVSNETKAVIVREFEKFK